MQGHDGLACAGSLTERGGKAKAGGPARSSCRHGSATIVARPPTRFNRFDRGRRMVQARSAVPSRGQCHGSQSSGSRRPSDGIRSMPATFGARY